MAVRICVALFVSVSLLMSLRSGASVRRRSLILRAARYSFIVIVLILGVEVELLFLQSLDLITRVCQALLVTLICITSESFCDDVHFFVSQSYVVHISVGGTSRD